MRLGCRGGKRPRKHVVAQSCPARRSLLIALYFFQPNTLVFAACVFSVSPDVLYLWLIYLSCAPQSVYVTLAGLPVLKSIAPTIESAAESLINMTPLKPSPEEVSRVVV